MTDATPGQGKTYCLHLSLTGRHCCETGKEMKRAIQGARFDILQALINARSQWDRYAPIWKATKCVIFLATPHGGSKTADYGSLLSKIATLAFQNPSTQLLKALKLNSAVLRKITDDFKEVCATIEVISFYERRRTPLLNSLVRTFRNFQYPTNMDKGCR